MSVLHVVRELRRHAPFTALGTLTGAAIMALVALFHVSPTRSALLFWSLHPLHVALSALVTAGMYRLHSRGSLLNTMLVGYLGSVGVATLSDSLIPFAGEWMLGIPHRAVHLGFIEKWWLVNPLALAGILLGHAWPHTRVPHAGHVLLSTWASLFHMTMAMDASPSAGTAATALIFLFLAVWIPCCTSDIVFPLLFARQARQ